MKNQKHTKFQQLVVNQKNKSRAIMEQDLDQMKIETGEILIRSTYSGINYKDALGVTFTGAIYKKDVIVPGIDVTGVVYQSKSKHFKEGDLVLVNGMGLGESYDGGYSEYVKVNENAVVDLPKGLTAQEAMLLGTSGFTAALAIERMIQNGQTWDKGPILVSGATGGVGQFAIQILSQLGFFVEAVTSKRQQSAYLESLGAHCVTSIDDIMTSKVRPLDSAKWGGVIDNLGGPFLEKVIPSVDLWGNVSSIGLALSAEFNLTVMPFILRGVSLLGASSNNCPIELRREIWAKLGSEWKPQHLHKTLNKEVKLEDIINVSETLIANKHTGKTVVKF